MPESQPTNKVISTWRILEATEASEYTALSEGNKELYKLIISAGTVNFTNGCAVRARLLAMFGAETVTRTSLLDL